MAFEGHVKGTRNFGQWTGFEISKAVAAAVATVAITTTTTKPNKETKQNIILAHVN